MEIETMFKKSVVLLFTLLVAGGGFLTLESLIPKLAKAQNTKRINVRQLGGYIANLCIYNKTQDLRKCTGKVVYSTDRNLNIPYNSGDDIEFQVDVVAGANAYYELADRDTDCWSAKTSLYPKAYCRTSEESPKNNSNTDGLPHQFWMR